MTQVADLRDAQGIREDQRAIVARLSEVEECASVHTLRSFMSKILRLENMLTGEHGGEIGEAIRACNRRLDSQKAIIDDFYARIRIQDWYHDLSDREEDGEIRMMTRDTDAENQPGMENRSVGRRRVRAHAPLRRFQRTTPRPPPPPPTQETEEIATFPSEMVQQAMQRLFAAYNQCVNRVAQTDDHLEQIRVIIRCEALELASKAQKTSEEAQLQKHDIKHIHETLFDDVQVRVKGLEERLRSVMDHHNHVAKTIDKNTHSQCASITALISEQADIRKLVECIANHLDQPRETSNAVQSETCTNMLLEINDLKERFFV